MKPQTTPIDTPPSTPSDDLALDADLVLDGPRDHDLVSLSLSSPSPTICGVQKRRKPGQVCQVRPPFLMANGRCRMHGGPSPGGIASPTFKHGRRSKYLRHLPAQFRKGYLASEHDPDRVALDEEIRLQDGRIADRLDQMNAGDAPPATWLELQSRFTAFETAHRAGNLSGMAQALTALKELIRRGATDAEQSLALDRHLLVRAKLCAVEARRQALAQEFVAKEQFRLFVKAALFAVSQEVRDREAQTRIQETILRLLHVTETTTTG